MQASYLWKKLFTKKHLIEHYEEKVKNKPSVGLDKVSPRKFEQNLDENIEIIIRKSMNDSYHFTRYKQLLFTKGPAKLPRAICVPTLRDKLTASVLNELLVGVYGDKCKTMMPQLVIDDITKKIPMYTHFIKLDVKSFYGSINHDKLIKIIKRKIHKAEIISIIWNAIRTEALLCPIKEKTVKKERILGVPEGLPISNTLANIYMQDIDIKYRNLDYISYYRYVDDILILVNEDKFYDVKRSICDDINKLGLELNDKEDEGFVTQTFEYLGYVLNDSEVTVRKSSILKIEQSIEELFRTIKKENIEYLQWKLNLKITGFIIERHKYGWLFFYSQITDLSLLFHLDDVVQKLIKRYKLEGEIKVKRFVRTYAEMHMALHETKYIPNLDDLGLDDKKAILSDIYQIDLSDKDERFVEIQFHRIMKREIRDTIIKNLMKQFDSDGDLLNANGVAGMDVTGKGASWQQLTSVSEEYRQKMFDNVKREFIKENGISNGDTTKRSDIFKDYQLSVSKDKRLSGTWTLEQYEGQYRAAMYAAVKSANPNWKPGQKFDTSILDNVTRESVESTLVKNGNRLVRNSIDVSV